MKNRYLELKRQSYEANMALQDNHLVIHTFGNVSAIDRDAGVIAIKPSGVPYENLKAEDMVVVDLNHQVVEGRLRPSSDTKTHIVLYQHFDTIGGIVHTHATYSVSWSQAMQPIPILGTTHADHLAASVPCTDPMPADIIDKEYEIETGHQIVRTFQDLSYTEIQMVLVACHGPFTWGETPKKAVYNSVILEELAKMACITLQISPATPTLAQSLIDKHYFRKHGEHAYYGQIDSQ